MRRGLSTWLLSLVVAAVFVSPASAIEWRFASDNVVGDAPFGLAVGNYDDVTGEDFIVSNSDDNVVEWRLSNRDGTFHETDGCNNGPTFGVVGNPTAIAGGDWRHQRVGDGLVTAGSSSPILTVLSQGSTGNCGFFPPNLVPFLYETGFTGLATGDLNGDGNDDAVASAWALDQVAIAMLDDDGAEASTHTLAVGDEPQGSTLADLNGDNRLDLVVAARGADSVSVALGHGDGTFAAAAQTGTVSRPISVAALGGTTDGAADLVVGHENGVALLRGLGNGDFASPTPIDTGTGDAHVNVDDVNGDGRDDVLVVYSLAANAEVLINGGGGSFQSIALEDPHIGGPEAIASLDAPGDGSHDIAVVSGGDPGNVTVFRGVADLVLPSTFSFGGQRVDAQSPARTLTLSNKGTATAHIAGLPIGGPNSEQFSILDNKCGAAIEPGVTCDISLAFEPSSTGAKSATLAIVTTVGPQHEVALSGTGETPTVDFSPGALDFGGQNVGTRSPRQTMTITNTGGVNLDVSDVELTGADAGHYELDRQNCTDHPVPANGSCTVTIGFDPTSPGAKHAALQLTDDAPVPNSTQTAALVGMGTQPAATVAPAQLDFGSADVGETSSPLGLTVTNSGDGPLEIGQVSIAGSNPSDFEISANGCGGAIAVAASCEVSVRFAPTAEGARDGVVRVTSNAPGPTAEVPLSGEGLTRELAIAPVQLAFGDQRVGRSGVPQVVSVTNTGSGSVAIGGVAIGGVDAAAFDLVRESCTGSPLAPGSSCDAGVAFAPGSVGAAAASLQISDNATGAPHRVQLSGGGVQSEISLSRRRLSFPPRPLRKAKTKRIAVTNPGGASLNVEGVRIAGKGRRSFKARVGGCAQPVAPGASCALKVTFKPRRRGKQAADLMIASDAPGPAELRLKGRGKRPGR